MCLPLLTRNFNVRECQGIRTLQEYDYSDALGFAQEAAIRPVGVSRVHHVLLGRQVGGPFRALPGGGPQVSLGLVPDFLFNICDVTDLFEEMEVCSQFG